MTKFQASFEFPKAEDLHLFRGVKSTSELKQILLDLKKSPRYYQHQISYNIRQWQKNKHQPTKHISFYFSCCYCKNQQTRPSIHFTSRNGGIFELEERSSFDHYHLTGRKRRPYRPRNQGVTKQLFSKNGSMSQSEQSWKQQVNGIAQKQSMQKLLLSDESESSVESDSWEDKQKLEKNNFFTVPKRQRKFDFPTSQMLQKIQTINSLCAINNKLSHFIRLKCYQYLEIRHLGKYYQEQDQNGNKITFLLIQFQCCKRSSVQQPYLRFIQQEPGIFHLKDYKIRHDHKDGRGRRKNLGHVKLDDKIKSESQMKNSQNKDTSAAKVNILDFILADHELMRMASQQNYQNLLLLEKQQQKNQQKQSQQKCISQSSEMVEEKQRNQNQDIDEQDSIYQKQIGDNHFLLKTQPSNNLHKSTDLFQAFHKKQKSVQKVVIKISSQSQVENQKQKENLNKKSIGTQKFTTQGLKNLVTKLIKKKKNRNIFNVKQISHTNSNQDKKYKQSKTYNSTQSPSQNLKNVQIYSWLQKYNNQVSKLISLKLSDRKAIKNTFQKQTQRLFYDYFQSNWNFFNPKTQQMLDQCVFKTLLWNKIQTVELSNLRTFKSQNDLFNIENKIFFKKFQEKKKIFQNQKRDQQNQIVEIYLAIFPIQIKTTLQKLKVLIAYTLTYQFYPNIIWFYVLRNDSKHPVLQNFSKQQVQKIIYFEVLSEGIKYYGLKKVNFIYTTLDCQLMNALEKICQTNTNSKIKVQYSIHFSCIKDILQIENIQQNFLLIQEIKNRIKKYKIPTEFKNSCQILKTIFCKQNNLQKTQSYRVKNPRIIYQNYRNFCKLFGSQSSNQQNYYSTLGMAIFSSQLLYNEREKELIEDSVFQLNSILSDYNKFNDISEFFTLLIRCSDFTFRKTSKYALKTQIVPSQLVEIQNECRIFYSLCSHNQKLYYPIETIFKEIAYEMLQIIRKCPRFITQTIYRLIIKANELASRNHKKSQRLDKNLYIYEDLNFNNTNFLVIPVENNGIQKFSMDEEIECVQELGKKWKCSCNFHKQTGIPCEHQILTAFENKDSLFKEIHSTWKNKYV